MTTAQIIRLVKGSRTLNLRSGAAGAAGYVVAQDFTPPSVATLTHWAEGTSANRNGGARPVGTRRLNRQWSFGVHILNCSSAAQINLLAGRLQSWLDEAGDENEPLYLFYRAQSAIGVEPLWGQDGLFYEIREGTFRLGDDYSLSNRRSRGLPGGRVALEIAPLALGRPQRLASATGGVWLDNLGTTDGRDRGVVLAPAVTNLCTNPVFGHATYDNDWGTSGTIVASKNTDPAYLLPDTRASVKLVASTSSTFFQTATLGATTHVFYAIVMLPDFGTPSSADVQLRYDSSSLTTTFTDLGNGRWLLTASAVGTAGSTSLGFTVKAGRSIYVLYYQAGTGPGSNIFVPVWGDLLGCTWSGTAHDSSSSRTAGRIRLPVAADTFSLAQGTIIVAWKALLASTWGNSQVLFADNNTDLVAYYNESTDSFVFSDGTNAATSAQTFAAGDILWLAFVWGPSGLAIYKNGVSIDTDPTYTPPALPSYLYIGTFDDVTAPSFGPFMDFRIYGKELTAAEVLADYTNRVALTTAGQRAGTIPWLWTKDGDEIVDNVDDSTRDNFCVAGGIPGSAPADTEYYFELEASGGTSNNFDNDEAYHLSLLANPVFLSPASIELLADNDGTATTSADLGSNVETISVNTSDTTPSAADHITIDRSDLLTGRQFYVLARLSDAGANLRLRAALKMGATSVTDYVGVNADATRRLYVLGPLTFPANASLFAESASTKQITVFIQMVRSVSGAANVTLDFMQILPAPVIRVRSISSTGSLTGINSRLRGHRATIESATAVAHIPAVTGAAIDLVPDQYNTLFMVRGNHGAAHNIGRTTLFEEVRVIPRYTLL